MFDYRRTHTCGELRSSHIGKIVTLSGWIHRRRDHGGIIFIDLRDRFGLTQLVFDPKTISEELFDQASRLRSEWVISVKGQVIARTEKMINPKLPTGELEIYVKELEILSSSKTPPFSICDEDIEVNEELRLKYRYLDIRRGLVAHNLLLRHQLMLTTRNFMSEQGFVEISTPILGKSTPEGARDYLVPSRIYPGNFYALPQSPQIFKQLLMISGMDRYFQIAPCFRDEDLRSDRQPEFTQIDLEMSFGKPEDIMSIIEELMTKIIQIVSPNTSSISFPKMSYKDCLESYGTDHPDLRFKMPLVRLDDIIEQSEFTVLREQLAQKGCIKAVLVKNGAELSRREIETYTQFVSLFGVSGLAWMKCQSESLSSNITKFFSSELLTDLKNRMQCEIGDLILIAGGEEARINQGLDHLRRKIAKERNLIDPSNMHFAWVTDFPLLRWNTDERRIESEHHPFTSPHSEDLEILNTDPLKVRALTYDLVLNGYEIGGGSQRIHNSELQNKIFEILHLSKNVIQEKFGFFVEALEYGAPPHLGFAFGLDRILMILAKTENIRDVIAFPKTQKASDLMIQTPAKVEKKQLNDLKVQIEPIEIIWT
ncbi:Aspartate--tRNA(Asp/Asn) ligase [Candidatus Rhabdochlamydia oedothoracis]|uniref:Aspartate--tRNA(Asp/Asn) ligase n=1 Tax=Candidatus Rhabdochlamydia oedothoracis TaxID=2720720 RepID=A0ABX8V190_9BACT|nr:MULTISPECIES: aspartate--tRNA ligase [Rhabdochlamydia]KAG6559234.1 Aspartate--tRNA(Asp/Asn) ligase [Candidatus Rhabdochlamydia sp. W815]QYF48262.1 Aspartate--tRNA(Asp/Asn) ligase [Candidatus Rhabdochlamydia oedothoracis]